MKQQLKNLTNLLTEMRLKENDGIHRTFVKMRVAEILTIPISVTIVELPFGKRTCLETKEMIEVRN
jgi:hypothetical protein